MLEQHEARRKNSKQPNSLTLEQEDRARVRFLNNKITKAISDQQKEIVDIVNIDMEGKFDNRIYTRYKKRYDQGQK